MKKLFLLLFLFSALISFSQENELSNSAIITNIDKVDSIKIDNYNKLAKQFLNLNSDSSIFYVKKALRLSQKIKNKKAIVYSSELLLNAISEKEKNELNLKERAKKYHFTYSVISVILFIGLGFVFFWMNFKQRKVNKILKNNNKNYLLADEKLKANNKKLEKLYENTNVQKEIIEEQIQILSKRESHFILAQEAGEIGTWEWDAITDELIWSDKTYEIFGLDKNVNKKLTNDIFLNFVHPNDTKRLFDEMEISIKEKRIKHKIEYRIIKNGEIHWLYEISKLINDENGKFIKMVGVVHDITFQKKQQQLLLDSEAKFKAITNSANDAIILINEKGNIELWNESAKNIFGYSEDEILNKNFIKYLLPEKYHKIDAKMFSGYKLENSSKVLNKNIELLAKRKSGEIFPIELSSSSVIINNEWKGVGIVKDITKRKKVLNLLQEQYEQQQILINYLPAHIYFKDTDFKYVLANKSYAKLFNLDVEGIIGKSDSEIGGIDILDFYEDLDARVIASELPMFDLVKEHTNTEGEKYWASTSKMPYVNANGEVKGVIGIVKDITEQIEYERQLEDQRDSLEYFKREITDSINYAQTIQEALLPSKKIVENFFKDSFILYKPKEIVSGDFYYLSQKENYLIFAVGDCTGHGVPGGFLTMLSITLLNDIVERRETTNVGDALNLLRKRIKSTFNTFGTNNMNGLDIAFCAIDLNTSVLQYSGAYNPLWIIRDEKLMEYKAVRNPIGFCYNEKEFVTKTIQLQNNDLIYLFSDGYQDQLGGARYKKFLVKRFREILLKNHKLPLNIQKEKLNENIIEWQGANEQVDDITVMGIKWIID